MIHVPVKYQRQIQLPGISASETPCEGPSITRELRKVLVGQVMQVEQTLMQKTLEGDVLKQSRHTRN